MTDTAATTAHSEPRAPASTAMDVRESRFYWLAAALIVAITLFPAIWGVTLTGARPALGSFSGFTFNTTDHCVYLSWMRQAADGQFFQHNLFTTEPQGGHQFNIFFFGLGLVSRLTHLSTTAVYRLARIVLGVLLLRSVGWLLTLLIPDPRARRTAFLIAALSAGVGWIPGLWEMGIMAGPVDTWQPEAVTFLSIYLFPLFSVSLLLMVGILGWLLTAERTGSLKHAACAGVCGLLLGNIHTYDVITVAAVWGGYLIARSIADRRIDISSWARAILAGALTAISTGYMAYLLKTEEVFAKRAAVPTLSPPLRMYLLGFGFVFVLALVGAWRSTRGSEIAIEPVVESDQSSSDPRGRPESIRAGLFLTVWAVANVVVAYLPVPFQRKMLMGAHLPLSMLAGIGLAYLLRNLSSRKWSAALAAAVVALSVTNARFLLRDAAALPENRGPVRAYMYTGEVAALQWIRDHAPAGAPVQPLPWIRILPEVRKYEFTDNTVACFTPGMTGHPVNAGHWGETPDFQETMFRWARFLRPDTTEEWRRGLLSATGIRFVLFTQKAAESRDDATDAAILNPFHSNPPTCLRLVPEASNAEADVYEVVP